MKHSLLTSTAIIAALGLSLISADLVHAQGMGGGPGMGPGGGRGAMMLQWFDTNDDGKISREEFQAGHGVRFDTLDTDRDGKVTSQEFQTQGMGRIPQRKQMMFQRLDADGDGALTRDEFKVVSDFRFDSFDLNNDGVIDQAELQQARQSRGQGMGPGGQGVGPGRGMGPGGPQGQR